MQLRREQTPARQNEVFKRRQFEIHLIYPRLQVASVLVAERSVRDFLFSFVGLSRRSDVGAHVNEACLYLLELRLMVVQLDICSDHHPAVVFARKADVCVELVDGP